MKIKDVKYIHPFNRKSMPPQIETIKHNGKEIGDILYFQYGINAQLPINSSKGGQKAHKMFNTRQAAIEWLIRMEQG